MESGRSDSQLRPSPGERLCRRVEELAAVLQREKPELSVPATFRGLVPRTIGEGAVLHLEDLSEITRIDGGGDVRFYQDRARMRAGDNDMVASCGDPIPGHETYCRDRLGLGSVEWLRPHRASNPRRIAEACWTDRLVRRLLINRARRDELHYLHPNMGTFAVWELAALLCGEAHCPIRVIAPPPGVARWVNDKICFTDTVVRLFGAEFAPRTTSACSFAVAAGLARDLAQRCAMLGFKLPSSAGGDGNIVITANQLRGLSLAETCQLLKRQLSPLAWDGCSPILIDSWEMDVLGSPAAQLWIPAQQQGFPVVEGIFQQTTEKLRGVFVGATRAELPADVLQEITDRTWLLARLFQLLGYVGRCSFDTILVGSTLNSCRLEFIECNGRWGGTSLYMTLMNRIFGEWTRQPFAVHVAHHIPGLDQFTFAELLTSLDRDLFDVRTRTGNLILANPGRLAYQAGITAVALAPSWQRAAADAFHFPDRLRILAQQRHGRGENDQQELVSTNDER